MKTKISLIIKSLNDYSQECKVKKDGLENPNRFIQYQLLDKKSNERKLVFKNLNYKMSFHKKMIFEHFYIGLILLLCLIGYSIFKEKYLVFVILIFAGLYASYKIISSFEIPNQLVFEGVNVYELNYFNNTIKALYPNLISREGSKVNEDENDYLFISSLLNSRPKGENIYSIFIKENENKEVVTFFNNFYKYQSIKINTSTTNGNLLSNLLEELLSKLPKADNNHVYVEYSGEIKKLIDEVEAYCYYSHSYKEISIEIDYDENTVKLDINKINTFIRLNYTHHRFDLKL